MGGEPVVSTIETAMTTAFGTIASDALSAIGAVLPIVLPVLGAMVVISLGIKLFKRITNKA